jgi:hypothetical protein
MLKKFLKNRIRPSSTLVEEDHSDLYRAVFEFLVTCISVPANAEQLIELGYKSAGKKSEEVFHTYLLFEKYLTSLSCRSSIRGKH